MKYSITNDKRNLIECSLYLISCVICAAIEIFILSKIIFNDQVLQTFWVILQCAITISPVLFVYLIKKLACNLLLKFSGIENISGIYDVEIKSNYKGGTTSHAKMEIKQTFDEIKICFISDQSKSYAINAKIDNQGINPILYYSYLNEGNGIDKNNKTHIGTAIITFIDRKIDGYYYNNGKDRQTYGTIKSINQD